MMEDILQKIVAAKREEVALAQKARPLMEVRQAALSCKRPVLSMSASLREGSGIIAEFKRRSPSKGWIHADADPLEVIPAYAAAGASALSILTDRDFFGGELDFIRRVRPLVDIPILRKDFIISEYQVYEAREAGADAILLIAACLGREECSRLAGLAHSLGLEVLLEIHSAGELDHLEEGIEMIGVNNRNLGSFVTDVANSFALAGQINRAAAELGTVPVSESGISHPQTVRRLRACGFRGFLMGENFMKEAQPAAALRRFVGALRFKVKVCGMTLGENIRAVDALGVDFMGFIFADGSPRACYGLPSQMPRYARKAGVFVDAPVSEILPLAERFALDAIQLHGTESPAFAEKLRRSFRGDLIKVIHVGSEDDFAACADYEGLCDCLLFDTRRPEGGSGGSGKQFDWVVLGAYSGSLPFLLGGGIGPEDAKAVAALSHPRFAGIDLNSRFETAPGVKNADAIEEFLNNLFDSYEQN